MADIYLIWYITKVNCEQLITNRVQNVYLTIIHIGSRGYNKLVEGGKSAGVCSRSKVV